MRLALAAALLIATTSSLWAADTGPKNRFPSSSNSGPTGSAQPIGGGGVLSLEAVMNGLADDATKTKIIDQLTTINWIATQMVTDPSNPSGPQVMFDPYVPLCVPPLIAFLQTIKGNGGIPVPPPTMANGALVQEYIVIRATPLVAANALERIKSGGLPPQVQAGCNLFLQQTRNLPFKLVADAPSNIFAFLGSILQKVTGL